MASADSTRALPSRTPDTDETDATDDDRESETAEKWNCEVCTGVYFSEKHQAKRHLVQQHDFDERIEQLIRPGEPDTADGDE